MHFIDVLYSDPLYMTIIIMVMALGCMFFSFWNPFRSKIMNYAYKGFLYLLGISGLLISMFFYLGLADNFDKMTIGRSTICLFEQYEQGGGESASETVTRLTVLDKNTGERKDRRYIGYTGELLGQRGDSVAYMYNDDLYVMDAITLKELYHVKKDEWNKEGVEDISDNLNYSEPRKPYLVIKGMDANTYWVDPFTRKKILKEPEDQELNLTWSSGFDLYVHGKSYANSILSQLNVQGSDRKTINPGSHYAGLFGKPTEESFIDPKFMCIDTVKKWFVFAHYKNTKKEEMTVEAKDFNFKTLWKKDSKALGARDKYNTDAVTVYQYENGWIYFNMGGFMFCMDPLTGKEKWKVRL